ncbi:hypothetical protein Rsub_03846 [Raphidocelis subcapitata]|uniref:Elongator complex protein 4 n=1 Tax=Raphidocelis subcapitata TaxID=307507 RepID=A0A2V0NTM4_9CHLO|nr:hypothetical protein Rsub_03846 [Raphidocelis subcapitata]|eukprot:GBF90991.1 hypothetical protein Rsub_03846 [Raphidocelis subcapitata]
MSAFTRRGPLGARAAAVDTGTRAGLHGQTLLSTGIADLDALLGGGLPLGAVLLVLEDAHSQQHLALVKHFLAEGVACGHTACWLAPSPQPGGPGAFVPAVAAPRADADAGTAQAADHTAAGDDGLRIAWQYRKYIQKSQQQQQQQQAPQPRSATASGSASGGATSSFARGGTARAAAAGAAAPGAAGAAASPSAARALEAGVSREWCHRFDAARGVGDAALAGGRLRHRTEWGPRAAAEMGAAALEFISDLARGGAAPGTAPALAPAPAPAPVTAAAAQLPPRCPSQVGRLVLQSLGSGAQLEWGGGGGGGGGGEAAEADLLQAVARLRLAAQDAPCATLVTCPAGLLSPACAARLQRLCDGVLAVQALADDSEVYRLIPDQASAVALLQVRRLPSNALARPRPVDEPLFVVRASRRRGLALAPFEVDVDAEQRQQERQQQRGGSGGGGGGGKAGGGAAALLCAGPAAAAKVLDF